MKTEQYITRLLGEKECVVVPGFGAFLASYQSATVNNRQDEIAPPSRRVLFNAVLVVNDGLLANAISGQEQVSYSQAMEMIETDVARWNELLGRGEKIVLNDLGVLYMGKQGGIEFKPDEHTAVLDETFGMETVVAPVIDKDTPLSGSGSKSFVNKKFHVENSPQKKRVITSVLVGLPLIAALIWSAFNIEQFRFQESPVIQQVAQETPVKEVPMPKPSVTDDAVVTTAENGVSDETLKNDVVPESVENKTVHQAAIIDVPDGTPDNNFCIIGGAFSSRNNAMVLVNDMRLKGYQSYIVDVNSRGLHRVCIQGYKNRAAAEKALFKIKRKACASAWILEK